jgi:putative transposase
MQGKQEIGRWGNNKVKNSHPPFRRQEPEMNRFRGMKTLQKFSSVQASVHSRFNQQRHRLDRQTYR